MPAGLKMSRGLGTVPLYSPNPTALGGERAEDENGLRSRAQGFKRCRRCRCEEHLPPGGPSWRKKCRTVRRSNFPAGNRSTKVTGREAGRGRKGREGKATYGSTKLGK
jgi:hypothetical protein